MGERQSLKSLNISDVVEAQVQYLQAGNFVFEGTNLFDDGRIVIEIFLGINYTQSQNGDLFYLLEFLFKTMNIKGLISLVGRSLPRLIYVDILDMVKLQDKAKSN